MQTAMATLFCILLPTLVPAASPVHFDLPATDGQNHRSSEFATSRATVLLFLATDCPISNRYSPLLAQLDTEYRSKGIGFFAVFSEATTHLDQARKHLQEFKLPMPGLLDPSATIARQTGARITPEAVVLSSLGKTLYRGRIDDRYVDWGKTRPTATQQDLRETLDAILANQPIPHPITRALGCAIPGL